jgi:signal transduction histidine kinase
MESRARVEVRQWVQRAIALYRSAGKDETLARIGDPEGSFVAGRRYIFVLDIDGKLLAHPYWKQLVGFNLAGITDSEGRAVVKEVTTRANKRGHGYTDYNWPLPNSKKELKKTIFFKRVDGMVLCSGFYSFKEDPLANFKL